MLIPTNTKNDTPRIRPRQQKFRTHTRPKITRRKCEICRKNFRDYRVLIDGGVRYVLCREHLRVARDQTEHFRMVVKVFRLGTRISSLGVVV